MIVGDKCMMMYKSAAHPSVILDSYNAMVSDGVLAKTFYDGTCSDFNSFHETVMDRSNHFWFAFYEGKLSGFSWLNGLEGRSARGHFCMFKGVYGKKSIVLGRFIAANYVRMQDSGGKSLLDVVVGVTPASNLMAIKWIKCIGAVVRGVIPCGVLVSGASESEDAVISSITRESTEEAWASA